MKEGGRARERVINEGEGKEGTGEGSKKEKVPGGDETEKMWMRTRQEKSEVPCFY